ncbi:MAG: hypothetical protein ABFD20_10180 [Anaerolineales bacterium]
MRTLTLYLIAGGAMVGLFVGVWQLWHADALAGFYLYQMALGLADLITLSLRTGRAHSRSPLPASVFWVAMLACTVLWPDPWWKVGATVAATLLAVAHRPDTTLFAALTLPVSLALLLVAIWRGAPWPWSAIILLLTMGALCGWRWSRRSPSADGGACSVSGGETMRRKGR